MRWSSCLLFVCVVVGACALPDYEVNRAALEPLDAGADGTPGDGASGSGGAAGAAGSAGATGEAGAAGAAGSAGAGGTSGDGAGAAGAAGSSNGTAGSGGSGGSMTTPDASAGGTGGDASDAGDGGSPAEPGESDAAVAEDPESICIDYCELFFTNCADNPANDYEDVNDCLSTCATAGWPIGTELESPGSIRCRLTHSGFAATNPALHCMHARSEPMPSCPP